MSTTQKSFKQHKRGLFICKADENIKLSKNPFIASEGAGKRIENKQNKRKMLGNNPLELMSRLEEYSNVWNDCPDVPNSLFPDYILPENKELLRNDVRKDIVRVDRTKNTEEVKDYSQPDVSERRNNLKQNMLATNISDEKLKSGHSLDKFSTAENSGKYLQNELSELKRIKAVNEHRQLHFDQKKIIKQALSSLDGSKVNKKVIFSDSDDYERIEPKRKNDVDNERTNRQQLFEESDEHEEVETNLKLNPQFEGKKGRKLLELQSKYASDSRFKLDTRFCDSGSEDSENEIPENEIDRSEKEKQLAILGSIVNRQIKPLSEIKKSSIKKADHRWMVRFDPTREDHSKYLLKPSETCTDVSTKNTSDEKKEKKRRKENKETEAKTLSRENIVQVSDEKFYSVKEDLKEALNTENKMEFSLLKLFGSKEPADTNTEAEPLQTVKKVKYNSKNPFKFDSSDSEPEEEEKAPSLKESNSRGSVPQPSAANSWRTTFFLTKNDSRFQEAFEFLKVPDVQEDDKEFAEKRKILKDFIKNKFKNNHRKNGLFKKKLGGLKKKSILKRKSRSR